MLPDGERLFIAEIGPFWKISVVAADPVATKELP
jgi:hypothetical protein